MRSTGGANTPRPALNPQPLPPESSKYQGHNGYGSERTQGRTGSTVEAHPMMATRPATGGAVRTGPTHPTSQLAHPTPQGQTRTPVPTGRGGGSYGSSTASHPAPQPHAAAPPPRASSPPKPTTRQR
jgi:hypothetical protein